MPTRPITWLDQVTVNPTTEGQQEGASITQLANGNILVSWESAHQGGAGSPAGFDILGRIFDPLGQPVTGEFRLNHASTQADEEQASVAALPDGGFVVTYRAIKDGSHSDLRIEEFDADGRQVSEASLIRGDSSGAAPNYGRPSVAVDASGMVLTTWLRQNADGTIGIEARLYDPATNAHSAVLAVAAGRDGEAPAVASLATGGFVMASVSADNGSVAVTQVAADGTVGSSSVVGATAIDGRDKSDLSVTALSGGGFVVAWTGTGADNVPRTYFHGVTPDGEFKGTAGPGEDPKVAALPDGGFALVHGDMAAGTMEAFSYAADGTRVGAQSFGPYGFGGGVVALGDGRLAVTWHPGELAMEILDLRSTVGGAVYTPEGWQVGSVGADVLTSTPGAAVVASWDGNDVVTEGGDVATSFRLGRGDDRMLVTTGLDGDAYAGEAGIDTVDWSASTASGVTFNLKQGLATKGDRVETMTGFENLVGTRSRDTIIGTDGANTLQGRAGEDVLRGQGGADVLTGGGGADDFVFASPADSGLGSARDVIMDFAKGQDDLVLTGLDANTGQNGNQTFTLDAGGAFLAGEVRQTRLGSDLLIELNTDADATAEMTILLRGVSGTLAASDFLL